MNVTDRGEFVALVADDDPISRRITERMLSNLGLGRVLLAADGFAALRCLDEARIDLLVLDVNMPGLDGIEALRHLATRHARCAVLIVSALDVAVLETVRELTVAHGLRVLGVEPKPLTRSRLELALGNFDVQTQRARHVPPVALTEDDVRRAIEQDELVVFVQPKVDVVTKALRGVEALVRWQHPTWGLIPPVSFVPLAERTGLIDSLTDLVLDKAVAHCAAWRRDGLAIKVAVNLAMANLEQLDLPERVVRVAERHLLALDQMILEVTEGGLMTDVVRPLDVLTRLRVKGAQLSIDDFGTGYSSMQRLVRVPFNELKLDQSFVRGALHDKRHRIVLESCISLAHRLELDVVAEGVETAEQWAILAALGCDLAQGYWIARPMPACELPGWARSWHGQHAAAL